MKSRMNIYCLNLIIVLFLISDLQAQEKTTINVHLSIPHKSDSVYLIIDEKMLINTINGSKATFVFNNLLKGQKTISVVVDEQIFKVQHFFNQIEIAEIEITPPHGHSIDRSPKMTISEYAQITLRSTAPGIDFIIDNDLATQGTTEDIRTLNPGYPHVILWKQGDSVLCKTNIYLGSGTRQILTYNLNTRKVKIN